MEMPILGGLSGRVGANESSFHSMCEGTTVAFARAGCSGMGLDENPRRALRMRRMGHLQAGFLLAVVGGILLRQRLLGSDLVHLSCTQRENDL